MPEMPVQTYVSHPTTSTLLYHAVILYLAGEFADR